MIMRSSATIFGFLLDQISVQSGSLILDMPLIQCPECNHSVSDKAVACPNCGFPLEPESETVKFDQKSSTNLQVDITESPYRAHQASPMPPLLGIDEATVISGCPESAGQSQPGNAHQQSPDYPVVPQQQHNKSAIKNRKINKNRVRWVRVMFWILWPIFILILTALMIKTHGYTRSPDLDYAQSAAAGQLLVTAVAAYVLVGIPCAIIELIICILRKRKDPSVRLPIRNLVIQFGILILVFYGGQKAQKLIAKAAQEKRNRIEDDISYQKRDDAKFEQEMGSLREFSKSGIDDQQKQLDGVNLGLEIEPEPLDERFGKLSEIADSSAGYRGLVMKSMVEGLRELSVLGQEYQKAAAEVVQLSEHDLQHLNECKKSLIRCKLLVQKQNQIFANYREFLERVIPNAPETIPFKDFDQDAYAASRKGFIDGGSKTITPTNLAYYQTEEEIWGIKIEEADFFIESFKDWEIGADGATIFDKQSDIDKLNEIQRRIQNAAKRSEELGQRMLDEKREKLAK
jgi:hypothetical protein